MMNQISALQTFALFGRTAVRRLLNRTELMKLPKFKKQRADAAEASARTGTVHRSQRTSLVRRVLGMWLPVMMLLGLGGMSLNTMFVVLDAVLLSESQTAAVLRVSPDAYKSLQTASEIADKTAQAEAITKAIDDAFTSPATWIQDASRQLAQTRFDERGLKAFEPLAENSRWSGTLAYLSPSGRTAALQSVGVFLALLNLMMTCLALGVMGKSLSGPDASLTWLWQFPVSRRVLFTSKLVEYIFDSPLVLMAAVFYASVLWLCGASFFSGLGIGIVLGLAAAVTTAAVRLAAEIFLTQRLGRRLRGSIVAVATAVGSLLSLMVMTCINSQAVIELFNRTAQSLPTWLLWNPLSAGIGTEEVTEGSSLWWLVAPATSVVLAALAVLLATYLTRFGLACSQDSVRDSARPVAQPSRRASSRVGTSSHVERLGTEAWKELLQLRRHPELLGQVLATPLLMVALMYFGGYTKTIEFVTRGGTNISVGILIGSAYLLMVAATQMLTSELKNLWLLQCQPLPLADVVRSKARVWAVIAIAMSVPFVAGAIALMPSETLSILIEVPFLFAALWWLAELIFGLTALAASVTGEGIIRFRRSAMLIPALLVSNAALAIYSQNWWQQLGVLAMLAILNGAVRQRQLVELAWLSEPVETPPKKLYAMHGLLAIVGFRALMGGLSGGLALAAELSSVAAVTIAYCVSALVVSAICLVWLRENGFSIAIKAPRGPIVRPVLLGLATSCSVGLVVTLALRWLNIECKLPAHISGGIARRADYDKWFLLVLFVVAAPIFEEWIFRGLLYRCLRRSWGVALSVVVSAILFATLHPVAGSVAVFTLGITTALAAEKTGRLLPSIGIHAGYNLMIWLLWLTW